MTKQRTRIHVVMGTPTPAVSEAEHAVYFTRVGTSFIPDATTPEEANSFMCKGLQMGTMGGSSVGNLESLFERVSVA